MSEYQCYEFVALDRQLTSKEMAELRSISTRAEITPTRFWNEYEWGDLKADAGTLLARHFDAHLYSANWGTRRFMLRLPARSVDINTLRAYFRGRYAKLKQAGAFIILDFWNDDDFDDDDSFEAPRLATLIPIRSQLLQGDLRAAYLGWLSAVQAGELDEDKHEPPVPAGLSEVPPPLASLINLLRLDLDLIAAAAESRALARVSSKEIHAWIKTRRAAEKDRWLVRAVDHPESATGTALLAAFREERARGSRNALRTVAELRARAQGIRAERDARSVRVSGRHGATVGSDLGRIARTRHSGGRAQGRRAPKS